VMANTSASLNWVSGRVTSGSSAERHQVEDDHHRGRRATRTCRLPSSPHRGVLPLAARAPPPDRSGAARGGDGGVTGNERAEGRRPGQGTRHGHRDLQVRGVADLRRPTTRGGQPRKASNPVLPHPQPFRRWGVVAE
jgi:hypothetical protein